MLPVLTEGGKRLFADYGMRQENTDAYVDVIIPVSFNFPNIGKLIMLFFILFAGWFSGTQMPLGDYPQFIFSGLKSFFGGVDVALPFMLDLLRIPADMYQIYVVTGIVNGRTATLLAAMNLLAFTLLLVSALTGYLKIDWRRIGLLVGTTMALLLGSMLFARFYFETAVSNAYDKDEMIASMQLLEAKPESLVYDVVPGLPPDPDPNAPVLERIGARGEIRIGYFPDVMPFSYVNLDAQLVGLDVEMMYELGKDLGVKPVFIPLDLDDFSEMLDAGTVDVAAGAIPVTASTLRKVLFSAPYMDVNTGFLVRDHDRARFADWETMHAIKGLTIAPTAHKELDYFFNMMVEGLPNAGILRIESIGEFFADDTGFYDAVLVAAEHGSALSILNPSYSVVVPRLGSISVPPGYPVAKGQRDFAEFISGWIGIKQKEHTFQRFYDYWILGQASENVEPRWSVIRNVLGWVE